MKSEGFKVKFMFSFLGLFVEAHSILLRTMIPWKAL